MVELTAKSAAHGLVPVQIGQVRLDEMEAGHLTSLSPLGDAMPAALKEKHGLDWPAPNRATDNEGARALWFGLREVLLMGPAPDAALSGQGAVVDQTDAWCAVTLQGTAAEDVLARLVPVDLRAAHFKRGHTVRSTVFHMNASITRTGPDSFLILVFRSMAATLVHDLKQAMAAVAARG